ncbi:MAG: site-specific integrase [Alphaproteobacteria bacterium]
MGTRGAPERLVRANDLAIRALKPDDARYIAWVEGCPKFGVRVTPNGAKSWVYGYRAAGKLRWLTIGPCPDLSLKDAREAWSEAVAKVARGEDPAAAKAQAREAATVAAEVAAGAPTVGDLIEEYITRYARPKKRTADEDERILRRELAGMLDRRADGVTRYEIVKVLDGIVDRGAPIMANRTLAAVRKMFNFARGRGAVSSNPAEGVDAPSAERSRDRVLTEEEIARLWPAIAAAPDTAPALRLALLFALATGQRKGEVLGATWAEMDLDAAVWTLTADRTKNRLPHRVPLTPIALEILTRARDLGPAEGAHHTTRGASAAALVDGAAGGAGMVFPSPRNGGPLDEGAIYHALQRIMTRSGMLPCTVHDLRRTVATWLAAHRVPESIIGRILNHLSGHSITRRHYDLYGYDDEKRAALGQWGEFLLRIEWGDGTARDG